MLKWIEEQIKAIFGILLFLGGIALILFFVKILYDQIFQNTINIDAISVPKVLSDGGYTEGVASAHLRDSIQKVVGQVVQNSRTAKAGPQVLLRTDIPDIIIPKFVIPLESISKFISRYFGLNLWHNLSGDFVVSDSKLKLRLRLDGKILYFDPDGVDLGSPDVALDRSVNWVLVSASPYIAVMAYMPTDPEKARSIARNLADESESKGEDVGWSYNVLGVFSYKDHKYDAAEQWFDKALNATKMYAQEQKDLPPIASSWKKLIPIVFILTTWEFCKDRKRTSERQSQTSRRRFSEAHLILMRWHIITSVSRFTTGVYSINLSLNASKRRTLTQIWVFHLDHVPEAVRRNWCPILVVLSTLITG